MEDMASRKTVISHLERVPDDALDEILDFIDFVVERHADDRPDSDVEKLQESSMASVWNSPEDEVWNDVPIR